MYVSAQWRARFFAFALALVMLAPVQAADWPAYASDLQRSNATDEQPGFPLRLTWAYHCVQPPRPAWPEPVKVINRSDFDYAFHPVVAGGLVCFGSSADDTVRALDSLTGAEKWHFITGGPVRFAPQIVGDKIYFASDDGCVYCLKLATGKLVWKFVAAPEDERLIGNERMISRWPARTGVIVDAGVVYTTSGMWPADGVFIYALDAADGKVIWCNDTSHLIYDARTLHMGEDFATYGVCPQGSLLASGDIILVPTGKALPAAFDRLTGKLLYYRISAEYNTRGGTWITIDGPKFHTTPHIISFSLATGEALGNSIGSAEIPAYSTPIPGKAYSVFEKTSAIVHQGKAYLRKAYGMILAGKSLVLGGNGFVWAEEAGAKRSGPSKKDKMAKEEPAPVLWRADVEGEARGLAFADGRLFVSTSIGKIYCFGPADSAPGAFPINRRESASTLPSMEGSAVITQLRGAGIDRGYALLAGDTDGSLATALAGATRMHVVSILADETAVAALREKLLATTSFYGSRIHVQFVPRPDALPFAAYFANAVIVAGQVPGLSAGELYRVLRPCGGLLACPGLSAAQTEVLIRATGADAREVQNKHHVLRGRLPGALDWDSDFAMDQRVKWPLRLLWFGGPGPAEVMDRKQFMNIGPVADGRLFVMNQDTLRAVDAYNGTIIWTRTVPEFTTDLRLADGVHLIADADRIGNKDYGRGLNADGSNVYLTIKGYFPSNETGCAVLDARTGRQLKLYAPYNAPSQILLANPQMWRIEIDNAHSGSVALQEETEGLLLKLTSQDPVVTELDRWDLYFDFRPPQTRYGLYERGTFSMAVFPTDGEKPASWTSGKGELIPEVTVSGTRVGTTTETNLRLSWAELARLNGWKPASFGFGVRLNACDDMAKERVVQRYLFCDLAADGLNNGWANVVIGAARATNVAPAVVAGPHSSAPTLPRSNGRAPPPGSQPAAQAPRHHPLTGAVEPKLYQSGGICGGPAYSACAIFDRSTAISIYDFVDDSGTRTFDGVKPGCAATMICSQGLLLSVEGRGGCFCTFNFQTSLAMAPVARRRNEDWALYFDLDADSLINSAALNFGAPGDRRADDGTLWLGYPRIDKGKGIPALPPNVNAVGIGRMEMAGNLRIPVKVEAYPEGGTYRFNADRVAFRNTDRPWIYASGYRGIRKAIFKLDCGLRLISTLAQQPPALDGKSDESIWVGQPQAVLPVSKSEIFLRHDGENLYILARRPAVIGKKGDALQWIVDKPKAGAKDDQSFYNDSCWEIFISDSQAGRIVHLRVMPTGAKYDALAGSASDEGENVKWDGVWKYGVTADDNGFAVELAIPWKTLADAGIDKENLFFNLMANGPLRQSEALRFIGVKGRERCENYVPLGIGKAPIGSDERSFTIRLHFAEPDVDVRPGQRVFDVKLQDHTVLAKFDIAKAAGAPRTALVREFTGIKANVSLTVEFANTAEVMMANNAPVLSALEFLAEKTGEK